MSDVPENNLSLRKRQAKSTRNRIYNTAFELITQNGFDSVTVDEICRQSGVKKGAFYHHFKSKDDIVIEAYKLIDEDFIHECELLPPEINNEQKIFFTVLYQARRAVSEDVSFVSQIYKSQIDTGTSFFVSPERPFFKMIYNALEDGQIKGEFRTGMSPHELTKLVLSISRGIIYDWCMDKGEYDIVSFIEQSFRLFFSGLKR